MALALVLVMRPMAMLFAIKQPVETVQWTAIILRQLVCAMRRAHSPWPVFTIGNMPIKVTVIGSVTPYATGLWQRPISLISLPLTWHMDRTIMANLKAGLRQ